MISKKKLKELHMKVKNMSPEEKEAYIKTPKQVQFQLGRLQENAKTKDVRYVNDPNGKVYYGENWIDIINQINDDDSLGPLGDPVTAFLKQKAIEKLAAAHGAFQNASFLTERGREKVEDELSEKWQQRDKQYPGLRDAVMAKFGGSFGDAATSYADDLLRWFTNPEFSVPAHNAERAEKLKALQAANEALARAEPGSKKWENATKLIEKFGISLEDLNKTLDTGPSWSDYIRWYDSLKDITDDVREQHLGEFQVNPVTGHFANATGLWLNPIAKQNKDPVVRFGPSGFRTLYENFGSPEKLKEFMHNNPELLQISNKVLYDNIKRDIDGWVAENPDTWQATVIKSLRGVKNKTPDQVALLKKAIETIPLVRDATIEDDMKVGAKMFGIDPARAIPQLNARLRMHQSPEVTAAQAEIKRNKAAAAAEQAAQQKHFLDMVINGGTPKTILEKNPANIPAEPELADPKEEALAFVNESRETPYASWEEFTQNATPEEAQIATDFIKQGKDSPVTNDVNEALRKAAKESGPGDLSPREVEEMEEPDLEMAWKVRGKEKTLFKATNGDIFIVPNAEVPTDASSVPIQDEYQKLAATIPIEKLAKLIDRGILHEIPKKKAEEPAKEEPAKEAEPEEKEFPSHLFEGIEAERPLSGDSIFIEDFVPSEWEKRYRKGEFSHFEIIRKSDGAKFIIPEEDFRASPDLKSALRQIAGVKKSEFEANRESIEGRGGTKVPKEPAKKKQPITAERVKMAQKKNKEEHEATQKAYEERLRKGDPALVRKAEQVQKREEAKKLEKEAKRLQKRQEKQEDFQNARRAEVKENTGPGRKDAGKTVDLGEMFKAAMEER